MLHSQYSPREDIFHPVSIEKDSILGRLWGEQLEVNSFHHQCLNHLGRHQKITATAPDGVIEAVEAVNERQKEIVVKKLQDKLGTLRGKTIALWGLAFKPETDDMREAPALVVIEKLLEAGASVKVYDPVAMDECRRRIGDRVVYCKDMYDVVIDADALAVLTEWKEFRIPSWSVIKRVMKQPVLVDGRNIYSKDEVIAEGFEYAAIGK